MLFNKYDLFSGLGTLVVFSYFEMLREKRGLKAGE